jgi:uncharacterized protein DUF1937
MTGSPSLADKYWYLCTPYQKYPRGAEAAYDDAAKMTGLLTEHDWFVFCPVVHFHRPSHWVYPYTHHFWLNKCRPFLELSKGLIVVKMPSWEESVGIKQELEWSDKLNLPVLYTPFMEIPHGEP